MPDPFLSQVVPATLSGPQLFVDLRHVDPGMVEWRDGGENLGVMNLTSPKSARPVPTGIPRGLRLRAVEGHLQGPLFELDRPWETNYNMYFATALQHDGLYKIWYTCIPPDNRDAKWERGQLVCYAESRDGITWVKPEFGLYEYQGAKTNAVFGRTLAPFGFQSGSVFYDPSAEPDERFKMIYVGNVPVEDMGAYQQMMADRFGSQIDPRAFIEGRPNHYTAGVVVGHMRKDAKVLCGAVSPDGIHWTARQDPISALFTDTLNSASWDAERNQYVAYVRTWRYGRRCIGRMTTTDFWHWPMLPQTVLEAGLDWNPADDIYTNSKTLVPGTTNTHIMFPGTFRRDTNSRDVSLASSIDDQTWQWVSSTPVVRRGRPKTWAAGDLNPGIGLVSLPDGKLALPVMVYDRPHKYPRTGDTPLGRPSWATWERNRIACLEVAGVGEFSTPPVMFQGGSLTLNHCTDPTGEIRVQVADDKDRPIPGFSFDDAIACSGDETDDPVAWRSGASLEALSGRAVRFKFELRSTKLFAFEVGRASVAP